MTWVKGMGRAYILYIYAHGRDGRAPQPSVISNFAPPKFRKVKPPEIGKVKPPEIGKVNTELR